MKKINLIIILASACLLMGALFFKKPDKPLAELKYYGDSVAVNGQQKFEYFTVGDFNFTNQEGRSITQRDLRDKIYITDFFFSTCQTICPVMTTQMQRVYERFKDEKDVCFISHTVDPEMDSVDVLAAYANERGINSDKWQFLTGNKKALYDMARKNYFLNVAEGDGGPDDFIHTPDFVLIDKEKHIRGYYDGTDSSEVNKLITDIEILLATSTTSKQ